MSGWAARRFWTTATAVPVDGGVAVHLDARPVRTPLKAPLILPTLALAEAVASEWQAQDGKVKPDTMPVTRTANSAIDKVAPQHAAVADMLAAYGESDLLCYRANSGRGKNEKIRFPVFLILDPQKRSARWGASATARHCRAAQTTRLKGQHSGRGKNEKIRILRHGWHGGRNA
jgi:hypothetical protein